jgi:NADPH:quinone reductase-like Zn-dependent oxidoreductase
LKAGERVLIHGASGGVGVLAVQLARWIGAHIVATASARNLAFVHDLGAAEVIDYKTVHFEKVVGDVDVVFDTIGGETLERSWSVLKPGGRMVTIASQSKGAKDERVRAAFFIVEPSHEQLTEIAGLLDAGKLRAFVEKVFQLDQARDAYAHARQSGHRGKVVLEIGE